MSVRRWSPFLLTALAVSTVAQAQSSQTSGAIRGILTNKKSEFLANATVVARNLETGLVRTVTTGMLGDYSMPLLPTGSYKVNFSAPGYKTIENTVRVTLGNTSVINPNMDSAEASATVEVVAVAATIDTTQVNTAASISQDVVEAVPLVSRNFTDMARLAPGVTAGSGNPPRLVVEGGRQIFNAVQIDGASTNSAFFSEQRGGAFTPFIFGADTIKELQVITNGFDVQYGSAGATVNAITKSGTNEFSGSALYQMRKTSWTAKPKPIPYDPSGTFNTPANLQRFNDSTNINFNLGGPIIKDKLWYFVGMERFNKSITASPIPTAISTAAGMTQADLTGMLASPLGQIVTNRSGATLAQEMGNPGAGTPARSYPMENTNTVYFGRLDYTLNERHRFVLRCNYQVMDDNYLNTSANPNNAESNNIPSKINSISWVFESNNIWTNELLTESRLQIAREARPMRNNAAPGIPSIEIPTSSSFMAFGTKTSTPRESNENTTQFFSSTSWTRGDFIVKGGVDYLKADVDNQFFQNNAGRFQFGTYGAARDWATGALGVTNNGAITYSGAVSPFKGRINMFSKVTSFFGQVQYAGLLEKRLTLTAGLRSTNQAFSDNPAPNPNFKGLDQALGDNGIDPRFGFSWDVDGKGKTVVRGGYGSFTSPTPLLLHSNTMTGNGQIITNYSFGLNRANAGNLALFNSGLLGASNLINGSALRKLSDAELATVATSGLFTAGASSTSLWDPNNKMSKSKKVNLGVEHEFGQGWVIGLSGTYVKYENLQRFENINLGQVGGTAYNDGYTPGINAWTTATRPNTATIRGRVVDFRPAALTPGNPVGGFSDVFLVKTDGWGFYRGMSMTAKKTWNEKTGLIANLTLSKAQDTGSFERGTYTSANNNFSSELGASLTPDPQDPASNFGYGDSDRRWVANVVGYFPIYWGIEGSARLAYMSGLPMSAYKANDTNGDGMANHFADGHTRGDMRQPGYTQVDIRLSRSFAVYKKVMVEGIVDVYNVFNKADYSIPSPNGYIITNAAFNQVAAVNKDKTREVQLGIRVKF